LNIQNFGAISVEDVFFCALFGVDLKKVNSTLVFQTPPHKVFGGFWKVGQSLDLLFGGSQK